jgi:SPOR domain
MRRTSNFSALIFLGILSLLLGCAGPTQQRQEAEETATSQQDPGDRQADIDLDDQVYVDVYSEAGDDWRDPWQPNIAPPARFDLMADRESASDDEPEALEQVQGFRIQLADVLSQENANAARDAALEEFKHVYVTFRSPNYKIRAGNYKSRMLAESELPLARSSGFRNAWIVPDWVFVNPPDPEPSDSLAAGLDSLGVHADDLIINE